MMSKPDTPNEKVCEELFLAYTLQYARSGKLIMYAPSQREEATTGYDASLFTGDCRELVLQFKRAEWSRDGLYFNIDNEQRNLLQRYPPNSAFYVAGSFEGLKELFTAQADQLTVAGFLDRYIAVPADVLIDGVRVYLGKRNYGGSYYIRNHFKGTRCNLNRRKREWLRGSELLDRFLKPDQFSAGASISIETRGDGRKQVRMSANPAIMVQQNRDPSFTPVDPQVLYSQFDSPQTNLSIVLLRYCL